MQARLIALAAGLAVALALPVAARADSVATTGSPATAEPFSQGSPVSDIAIDATSGPGGESPSGQVSLVLSIGPASGPVTCLRVTGERAVVGFTDPDYAGAVILVVVADNGPGSPLNHDELEVRIFAQSPTDCTPPAPIPGFGPLPVIGGDIAVDDEEVDTPPALTAPRHVVADAASSGATRVSFAVTATDDEDASPEVACSPASGSGFAPGVTTVTCTATDAAGNSAQRRFPVVVRTSGQQVAVVSDVTHALEAPGIGPLPLARVNVVAVSGPGGQGLTGTATLDSDVFVVRSLSCLAVEGSRATIGLVLGIRGGGFPDAGARLNVNDNGTPGPSRDASSIDQGSSVGLPPSCPTPPSLGAVATIDVGEVTVRASDSFADPRAARRLLRALEDVVEGIGSPPRLERRLTAKLARARFLVRAERPGDACAVLDRFQALANRRVGTGLSAEDVAWLVAIAEQAQALLGCSANAPA